MSPEVEQQSKALPPPWDRIFSLGTRTFVWALLVGVLYILRPFFLLIFLTFVFAYIQAHGVDGLQHRLKSRPLRVTIVGLVFLGTILATGFTLFPQIEGQASKLLHDYPSTIQKADAALNSKLKEYPQVWTYLTKKDDKIGANGSGSGQSGEPANPATNPTGQKSDTPHSSEPQEVKEEEPRLVKNFVDSILGLGGDTKLKPKEAIEKVFDVGSSVLGYVSSFLLSLLFSFLIVMGLPQIKRSVMGLADTKIDFIYVEVANSIATFGKVLGRALEAQLIIAVCNTILTAIGIYILGVPSLLVLSAIVFLCSFVPVVGVFISSTPICLLALQDPGGFSKMLGAILLILIIHTIETYILNPRIFGHHLRMNPVLVLIVLTVGGKLFGIWGLVLGLPIVNYFFRHAIRRGGVAVDDGPAIGNAA